MTPQAHLFQVLHLCSGFLWFHSVATLILGTEPPVQAAFSLETRVRLYPLVSVMQAWVAPEAAGGRVMEWSAGPGGGIHLAVLLWKLLISSGLDSDYPLPDGKMFMITNYSYFFVCELPPTFSWKNRQMSYRFRKGKSRGVGLGFLVYQSRNFRLNTSVILMELKLPLNGWKENRK